MRVKRQLVWQAGDYVSMWMTPVWCGWLGITVSLSCCTWTSPLQHWLSVMIIAACLPCLPAVTSFLPFKMACENTTKTQKVYPCNGFANGRIYIAHFCKSGSYCIEEDGRKFLTEMAFINFTVFKVNFERT